MRAVPPQEGPVLLLFTIIIIMIGRVLRFPEVDARGSVESAPLAAAPTNLTRQLHAIEQAPSRGCRVDGVPRE